MPRAAAKKAPEQIKRVAPVNQPAKELNTGDLPMAAAPVADINKRSETIVPVDAPLENSELEALKFNEDALTIIINPSNEDNAPIVVDCWVNGKGAEVLDTVTGKFIELNCLPIGQPIITKRKYVEVIARSRTDKVSANRTTETPEPGKDGFKITRQSSARNAFSVLHDPSPKGREWLTRLMAER
jgi:hypothetical protein